MSSDLDKKINYLRVFFVICLLIFGISIGYFFAVNLLTSNFEDRGTFGDMFGALNAIFSGFAFAGVIITIIMQMKELELTRNELKKSAEAQDKSQQALNEQLQSMQVTTKLDTLNKYIEQSHKNDDAFKIELAQNIITSITEDIFQLDEYSHLTKPRLISSLGANKDRPIKSVILKNIGASLNELKIHLKNGVIQADNRGITVLKSGSTIVLGVTIYNDYEILIEYRGAVINTKWQQLLTIKSESENFVTSISSPELAPD